MKLILSVSAKERKMVEQSIRIDCPAFHLFPGRAEYVKAVHELVQEKSVEFSGVSVLPIFAPKGKPFQDKVQYFYGADGRVYQVSSANKPASGPVVVTLVRLVPAYAAKIPSKKIQTLPGSKLESSSARKLETDDPEDVQYYTEMAEGLSRLTGAKITPFAFQGWFEASGGESTIEKVDRAVRKLLGRELYQEAEMAARLPQVLEAAIEAGEVKKVEVNPKRCFTKWNTNFGGIWPNPRLVDHCNSFVPDCGCKFDFNIQVGSTVQFGTQYLLKPANSMVFDMPATLGIVVHELAHHVYHKMLTAAERKQLAALCKPFKGVDPNEQFATYVELSTTGKAARLQHVGTGEVTEELMTAPLLKKLASPYFKLPKAPKVKAAK